jgi:hypothetical protein
VAWRDFWRAGRPTARPRISGEHERRWQSAREGASVWNEAGERERVQARVKKELGRVDERRGWSPRWTRGCGSTTVARKMELTRLVYRATRESEGAGKQFMALTRQAHNIERDWACAREGNGADRSAPPGIWRWGESVWGCGLSLTGGTHLSGDASARVRPGWAGLAGSIFPFLWISKGFSVYLFLWISNQIQTKFKYK